VGVLDVGVLYASRFFMTTPRMSLLVLTATFGAAILASGCGLHPPVQNSGAVATADGIQIALLGQRCSQTVETDWAGNDLVEMTVQIEVRNGTSTELGVHRDDFRLIGADGRSVPPSSGFANDPISLAPRQAQTFQLRFMSRGGLSCSKEMTLESPSAIVRGTETAKLGTIKFVAAQAVSGYEKASR
jgi:hypothetical protein